MAMRSWHPKLTLYRLLVVAATFGLGIAKAATSYLNLNYASVSLEWITGVVVFIFLHVLGAYEDITTPRLHWLFHDDYLKYLWHLLAILGVARPQYRSDESINLYPNHRSLPITGYRILVTILVIFFGTLKFVLSCSNLQKEATTVECVFGIGIALMLYWLGLYEDSAEKVFPMLFHYDFSPEIFQGIAVGVQVFIIAGKLLLCAIALTASVGVSAAFFVLTKLTLNYQWYQAFFPEYPVVSWSTGLIIIALMGSLTLAGVGFGIFSLYLTSRILFQSPFISRRRVTRIIFLFFQAIYVKYWTASSTPIPHDRAFFLKRLLFRQAIKLPLKIYVTFVLVFVLFFLFWFALMCAYIPALMLESYANVPVTLTFPLVCFISFPVPILMGSVFVCDFYRGFLNFLADIRHDYVDRGTLLPTN